MLGDAVAVMLAAPTQQTDLGMDRHDLGKMVPVADGKRAEVFAQLGSLGTQVAELLQGLEEMCFSRNKVSAQAINRAQGLIHFRVKEGNGEKQLLEAQLIKSQCTAEKNEKLKTLKAEVAPFKGEKTVP